MSETPPAALAGCYVVADDIRFAEDDDGIIILDCRNGEYVVADRTASAMWNCLLGKTSLKDQITQWSRDFGLSADEAVHELHQFAQACERAGRLRRSTEPSRASVQSLPANSKVSRWPIPRLLLAGYYIVSTARSLRRDRFPKTYRGCQNVGPSQGSTSHQKPVRIFLLAENIFGLFRKSDDCLLRSLALFRYLRACGVAAEHVIGVKRIPFQAHAWVEVSGSALLEERIDGFVAVATLSPQIRESS